MIMLALVVGSMPAFSQYKDADLLLESCRGEIVKASERLSVDSRIVESVVYPELMRYSALRGEIEASLVNGFYVKFGSDKGDFSIGYYQMKPSFVEILERKWNVTDSLADKYQLYFNSSNSSEYSRSRRVARMMAVQGQSLYAAIFVKMMFYYFPELAEMSDTEQVRLMATAYNSGVEWPRRNATPEIRIKQLERFAQISETKKFHTDIVANPFTEYLSYADLALEHYVSFF